MTFSALDSALVGPLLATDAMRAVFGDPARVAAMLRAEAALARAQARAGLVPPALAEAVAAIDPDDLDRDAIGRATAVAGVPTIPFVKAVQARLPAALARDVHRGATTQDILDTALVLQMREGLALIERDLGATIAALLRLAETHRATPCVGRTYGQHAAPITFGVKAAGWALGLAEVAEGLAPLRARVLAASLGGPVGTLAGLGEAGPSIADGFAAELGLAPSALPWHARRGRIAETGAWLGLLVGALAKMATDVASLASTEIGEVAEPWAPGRGGSSAMPHKRNPVSATVILAAQGAAPGHVATLLTAMGAAHERPAGPWHAEWHALPTLFGLASGALAEGRRLGEGLSVRPERMRRNLDATRGLLFADAAAARLAGAIGREAAHALVADAAARVLDTDRPLSEVLRTDPAVARALSPADIDAAFDLAPAVSAAARFTDRAVAAAAAIHATLRGDASAPGHEPA